MLKEMQLPSFPKVSLAKYNYSESQLIAYDVIPRYSGFEPLFCDLFYRADGNRCPTPVKLVLGLFFFGGGETRGKIC